MLSVQAHSFQRQLRLAVVFASLAGYVNAIVLVVSGVMSAHLTGVATQVGRDVARARWEWASFAGEMFGAYVAGACVAGVLVEVGRRRGWRAVFLPPIAIETVTLAVLAAALERAAPVEVGVAVPSIGLVALASFAMGLQNASTSRISSGMVRTTHVTGVATDLGIELAQLATGFAAPYAHPRHSRQGLFFALAGHETVRRIVFLSALLGAFIGGAGLGVVACDALGATSVWGAAAYLASLLVIERLCPVGDIVRSPMSEYGLPDGMAVFAVRPRGLRPRLPNLLAWIDGEATRRRVLVLDLSAMGVLRPNDVLELCALLLRMRRRDQDLVIAGISRACFAAIRRVGAAALLIEPLHLCPDVEMGLALGLALLEEPAGTPSPHEM